MPISRIRGAAYSQLHRAAGCQLHRAAGATLVAVFLFSAAGWAEVVNPGLGERLTATELEGIAKTILPDGTGLPAGSGSVDEGAALYATHCQACHGPGGAGGINDRLVGGQGSLAGPSPLITVGSYWPYATTLFDYVRRAMPYQYPGSMSDDEVYAVTAYVLFRNGIIEQNRVVDARVLAGIRMPNADGFYSEFNETPNGVADE